VVDLCGEGGVREMCSRGVRGVAWYVGNREFGIRGMGSVRGLMCRPSLRPSVLTY